MDKLVCAILVNYNGAEDTNACVESLLNCAYNNIKIIIVDNNSTTGKVVYNNIITQDKCEILYEEENLGFAGANNVGIRYGMKYNPDYFLIINNDTVVTQNFLNPLIRVFNENDNVGIATGKIFYFDDHEILWFGGSYYDQKLGECKIDGIGHREDRRHLQRKEIPFATGCLWLLPSKIVEKVGYMSEEYFLYYEDADYCERVKQCGYTIIYEPKSIIYHKESRSTKRGSVSYYYYNIRNYLIFISKYASAKHYLYKAYISLKDVIRKRVPLSVTLYAWIDFAMCKKGRGRY